MAMKPRTIIFDISGVIVDARANFCRKIDVSMRYAKLHQHDISFEELLAAFGRDQFPKLFEDKISDSELRGLRRDAFYEVWEKIPEFYPGRIHIFNDVIPTLRRLLLESYRVVFASRLGPDYREILRDELKRRGLDQVGDIVMFGPTDEERFLDNCMDLVFSRVMNDTDAPRVYVDDSINRMALVKEKRFDRDIYCVGATTGFFGESMLRLNGADDVAHELQKVVEIARRQIWQEVT